MRRQTLLPVLLLIGHLDQLYIHAITVAILAGLVIRERALDECLRGIDIPRRRGRPDLLFTECIRNPFHECEKGMGGGLTL